MNKIDENNNNENNINAINTADNANDTDNAKNIENAGNIENTENTENAVNIDTTENLKTEDNTGTEDIKENVDDVNTVNSKNKGKNSFNINKVLQNRSFKYGSNSLILIAVVCAIAVLLNILVDLAQVKWDLTPNKLYSISDTTRDILKGVDKEVVIYGLFDDAKMGSTGEVKQFTELIEHYTKYPNIKVQYVDPDKNPGIFKEIDPEGILKDISKNAFVVKCGNKLKAISSYDLYSKELDQQTFQLQITGSIAEQAFTGAIKYVTAEFTPTIYFTAGHDEKDIDSNFSTLKQQLVYNNYDVKPINLITEEKVPEDAEIMVVASPKKDLTVNEKDKIEEYLKNGGKAIFMFDYLELDPQLPQFENVLMEYNVSLNYDKVKENDEKRHLPQNPYVVLMDVQSGQVASEDYNILLANSRSINILKNVKEYITVTSLAKTSNQAVGERVDKTKGDDIAGPLDVAVAVEHKGWQKISKIVVMGNSTFLEDSSMDAFGPYFNNGIALFLESVNWMQEKKDDLTIAPKTYQYQYLEITAQQAKYMGIVVGVVLPLIILFAGLFVYLRRRHL